MQKVLCEPCGGPPFPKEEHELFMQKMRTKNAKLKEEVSDFHIHLGTKVIVYCFMKELQND